MKGNDLKLIDKSEIEDSVWYNLITWDSKMRAFGWWESSWFKNGKKKVRGGEQGAWVSCKILSPTSHINKPLHGFLLEKRGKNGTILVAGRERMKNSILLPLTSILEVPLQSVWPQKYGTLLNGVWNQLCKLSWCSFLFF